MAIPPVIREKAGDFGDPELEEYILKVKKLLKEMAPGASLEIEKLTREKNRDLFIECVKLYIRENEYQGGVQFNSDFTRIVKYEIF